MGSAVQGWTGRERARCLFLALALLVAGSAEPSRADTWLLQNGQEYYGTLESYSFRTNEVRLRKADGKQFAFPARDLAFGAKSKLIASAAFFRALPGYRPPLLALVVFPLAVALGLMGPVYVALVGSVHVLGAGATLAGHVRAFLKVAGLGVVMGLAWMIAALVLDPGVPLLPDTNADLVLILTSLNCGIFFCSLLISTHYQRSFWKGMAVTLLMGVFSAILWTAEGLALLFVATRSDFESVITRFVFQPLRWF